MSRLLAARPDLQLSVAATTRRPRPDEVDGRHYHFVDPDTFDRLVGADGLLQWAEVFGHRYGTPREPVERALREGRTVIVDIDVQGARQIRATSSDAFLVFLTASEELAAEPEFDATVVNDRLDDAAREVIGIVDRVERRTMNSRK